MGNKCPLPNISVDSFPLDITTLHIPSYNDCQIFIFGSILILTLREREKKGTKTFKQLQHTMWLNLKGQNKRHINAV